MFTIYMTYGGSSSQSQETAATLAEALDIAEQWNPVGEGIPLAGSRSTIEESLALRGTFVYTNVTENWVDDNLSIVDA